MYQARLAMTQSHRPTPHQQVGASLIELMVGITIGMLVVLAAMSTIVLNRTSSTTIADTSALTSQGNNVLRQMAYFIRHAGTVELTPLDAAAPLSEQRFSLGDPASAAPAIIAGLNGAGVAPDEVTATFLHRGANVTRDCLGNGAALAIGAAIPNRFFLNGGNLNCQGLAGTPAQPVAQNVEDLQVTYLIEAGGGATRQWVTANAVANWNDVVAANICIQIRGDVNYGALSTGNFTNCSNVVTANDGPMRMVLRQTVQLRNRSNNL